MAQLQGLHNLAAAREILKSSLEKSRDIAFAINETGPRLDNSSQRLASLEATIRGVAHKCTLYDIRRHVDRAVGPAAAVLRIFDMIHELEDSLPADPSSDLLGYFATIQRIEEAVRLLSGNCKLVILWLEDALQFLEGNAVADDRYIMNVKKSLHILGQLQATEERFSLEGGLLVETFNKLENEFRRLLIENSFPPHVASLISSIDVQRIISPISFPLVVVEKLQIIIERLTDSNRLEKCISIYVEARSSIVRTGLQALGLDYLEISLSEFDSVQNLEGYIDQWGKHLQFAVKYLFEMEYRLCSEVFQKSGSDVWQDCFAKIVFQSGFYKFIKFGNTITRGKKDAIKLLKLLDIFAALHDLRLDFNTLFRGKACLEIQTHMRDLINKVINGACEIFWELSIQVESQRPSGPPLDGNVPRLVQFVADYCNMLLEDEYKSTLLAVLEIYQCWNDEEFEEGLLSDQIKHVMKALELNLETWAKTYKDTTLSYFFTMNNYWYLCNNVKGTKLGDLMGHNYLRGYEENMEHYAAAYLRESWAKLPAFLDEEGLILFPGGRAVNHYLVQKRLNEFNKAFDDMYRKQSKWVLFDEGLRMRTRQLIVTTIIPPYKSYIQAYMPVLIHDDEVDSCEYVKYPPESMQETISSLFQPKLGECGSTKCTPLAVASNVKNVVSNHFPSTPAAA